MKSFTKTFYNCANLMKECTIINISKPNKTSFGHHKVNPNYLLPRPQFLNQLLSSSRKGRQ